MRCRRGIAAIEFALIAPLLLLLLVTAADLGHALQIRQRLTHAAQVGGHYATRFVWDEPGIRAEIASMLPAWPDLSVVIPPMTCECPGTAGTVDCASAVCTAGLQRYVSIQLSVPFTPIFWTSIDRIEASAQFRIQ